MIEVFYKNHTILFNSSNGRWLSQRGKVSIEDIKDGTSNEDWSDFTMGECYYIDTIKFQPHIFNIKMTNNCNFNCTYCYNDSRTKQNNSYITREAIDSIFTKFICPNNKIDKEVIFHGGEPLQNFEIIEYTVEKYESIQNIRFNIQTNGSIITLPIIKFLECRDIGISVSLDGPEEINNSQRQDFEKVLTNINLLRGNRNIKFNGIACTLTKQSIENISDILDFFVENKFYHIQMQHIITTGRAKNINEHFEDKIRTLKNIMSKVLQYYQKNIFVTVRELSVFIKYIFTNYRDYMCVNKYCGALNYMIAFDTNGDMYPCDLFIGNSKYKFNGNINTLNDFHQKVNNKKNEICKNCPAFLNCFGIQSCSAEIIFNHEKNELISHKYCHKFQLIMDIIIGYNSDELLKKYIDQILNNE